jgi:hypothetical protein
VIVSSPKEDAYAVIDKDDDSDSHDNIMTKMKKDLKDVRREG